MNRRHRTLRTILAVLACLLVTLMSAMSASIAAESKAAAPLAEPLSWKRSPTWTGAQAGPQDGGGRAWHDPAFDDAAWQSVTLPDTSFDLSANDRYYRARFTWDGTSPVQVSFASDDGLAVYVNGIAIGTWGSGWHQSGCVNAPPTCVNTQTVPAVTIPPQRLHSGDNVIAVDLWNAATCCFYYLNLQLTGNGANTGDLALAEKFKPFLYFYKPDIYRPIGVAEPLAYASLVTPGEPARRPASLQDLLAETWDKEATFIDFDGEGSTDIFNRYFWTIRDHMQPKLYARVDRATQPGRIVLQYWLFYFDNDWRPVNHHEGDWEMLQVVLNTEEVPLYAAYSQHVTYPIPSPISNPSGGSRREWLALERRDSTHPVAYVAGGSHANYFKPYIYFHNFLDGAFGLDFTAPSVEQGYLPIELIPSANNVQHWSRFLGHWGAKGKIVFTDAIYDGDGPPSPAQQGVKWDTPYTWSERLPWDENAPHNRDLKFNVSVRAPFDVSVQDAVSKARVGWKDGQIELGIPSAEYFDNATSHLRTIVIHNARTNDFRYGIEFKWRPPAGVSTLSADVDSADPITATLNVADPATGQLITATYQLSGTWGISSTGIISAFAGSDFALQFDVNGDGLIDQTVLPSSLQQSQSDFTPPGPINDLHVISVAGNSITLGWTAPGDDGAVGRAALYDLRYAPQPITEDAWPTATRLTATIPSNAGTIETLTMTSLPGGTLYLALQASDDMRRLSRLSNVASVRIPYLIHAPIVTR